MGRNKPAMPPGLRSIAALAKERHGERFAPPKLAITGCGADSWLFDCPYRVEDREDWDALLFQVFGTRSQGVVRVFLGQLSKLCGQQYDCADSEWRPEPDELNTALAVVASLEPDNEAQACIAMNMVGLHFTAMKLGGVMGGMTYPDERTAATMARVSKAYAELATSLARLQGKVRGSRHEIHVSYYDQRQQAVVMGREQDFGGQPYANATATATGLAALPSLCADYGAAMSLASGQQQASLPDAWWRKLWRAVRAAQRRLSARGLD